MLLARDYLPGGKLTSVADNIDHVRRTSLTKCDYTSPDGIRREHGQGHPRAESGQAGKVRNDEVWTMDRVGKGLPFVSIPVALKTLTYEEGWTKGDSEYLE